MQLIWAPESIGALADMSLLVHVFQQLLEDSASGAYSSLKIQYTDFFNLNLYICHCVTSQMLPMTPIEILLCPWKKEG